MFKSIKEIVDGIQTPPLSSFLFWRVLLSKQRWATSMMKSPWEFIDLAFCNESQRPLIASSHQFASMRSPFRHLACLRRISKRSSRPRLLSLVMYSFNFSLATIAPGPSKEMQSLFVSPKSTCLALSASACCWASSEPACSVWTPTAISSDAISSDL